MAKIISILNQKGGVGKTTSTFNLSTVLAMCDKKILMIDSDSQASLTLMTANDPISIENNLSSIYKGNDINLCIYHTTIENLDIIPSSIDLAKTEVSLMSELINRESKLKKALSSIRTSYDYIFIDCPPSLSLITINNLVASDYVIAPVETSMLGYYALDDLLETIENIKEINGELELLGIIATRYDKRVNKDTEILNELKEKYDLLGTIKSSTDARKGIEDGLPVVIFKNNSDVAKAYIDIGNKLLEVL